MEKPIPDLNENIKEISSVNVLFACFVIHELRIILVKMKKMYDSSLHALYSYSHNFNDLGQFL